MKLLLPKKGFKKISKLTNRLKIGGLGPLAYATSNDKEARNAKKPPCGVGETVNVVQMAS